MKKKYEKPLIAVENYVLSQAIASCSTRIGFNSSACVFDDVDAPAGFRNLAGIGYFTADGKCTSQPNITDVYDNICYHTSANAMFQS